MDTDVKEKTKTQILTINVTEEQEKELKAFYTSKKWDWNGIVTEVNDDVEEFDPENVKPGYLIKHDEDKEECPHCLCSPCITDQNNRQLWWPVPYAQPNRFNNKLRKKCYKNFWTWLFHKDVWRDPRYRQRKEHALGVDRRHNRFVWLHKRDIMPNCVVSTVRLWYPNEPNVNYMGHLWQ